MMTKGCNRAMIPEDMKMITTSHSDDYLILVHGLARTPKSLNKAQEFFEARGYRVINFSYPSTKYPIPTLSQEYLGKFIRGQNFDPGKKIHFVTHSMGGILLRFYLEQEPISNLGRVVMLAPPNQGSEVPDRLQNWFFYRWVLGPAGQQLGTDPHSIPQQLGPVNYEVGVIAGDRSINFINSLFIPGPDDGKVSVEHTKVEGMQDFLLVHKTHTFMMRDTRVLSQVDHFLKAGKFWKDSAAASEKL